MTKQTLLITAACALLLASCDSAEDRADTATQTETAAVERQTAAGRDDRVLVSGIDQGEFDSEVRPQDDFYAHVNGLWIEKTEIPADRPSYGAFAILAEDALANQRQIVEELSGDDSLDAASEKGKIGNLYASFLDTETIEEKGLEPLAEEFAAIDAIASKDELMEAFARLDRLQANPPLGMGVFPDFGDSTQYIVYIGQGGLTLPDRDYYSNEGARFEKIRAELPGYVEKMLALADIDAPAAKAEAIVNIETKLAEDHWTAQESRDFSKIYNPHPISGLNEVSADLDWQGFTAALGLEEADRVVIAQPSYFAGLAETIEEVPLEDWKTYLKFRLLNSYAPLLPKAFDDAEFAFNDRIVNGTEEQAERWKRGVRLVNAAMGEAVGKVYVERHFPPEAKARMEELVDNLLVAFRQGIDELEWMSEETKEKAREKLAKFSPKIGYPNEWRDYSTLEVAAGDVAGNMMRANAFEYQRNLDKLGEPIDREEWGMTPQTVNAYYDPTKNEIVFPAAILQPPFFDLAADDAINYGAIGAVIGHEISHGFDDQGAKFDGDGNLRNWFTEEDLKRFQELGDQLAAQYDQYSPADGLNVNGRLTLGENIGDLSGLTVAYRAYQISLDGEEAPVIDGLTGDQRFFLGWALAWRAKMRDELMARLVTADPHSPPEFRVKGVVVNMDPFYEAFDVEEGDGMYKAPEDRISVW